MKRTLLIISILTLVIISQNAYSQNRDSRYKMEGSNPKVLTLNQTYSTSGEIYLFDKTVPKFFGLSFTGSVVFEDETSEVRLLLVDKDFNEYLVYESYPLLEQGMTVPADDVSEETALLEGVQAYSLRIELVNASVTISELTYTTGLGQVTNISEQRAEKKRLQDEDKISRLNRNLKDRGQGWVAGPTEVSGLSYSEKKQLFGQSTFPAGFEYYSGGVISTGTTTLKSASSTSQYARVFDWRDRHGQNWITPVVNQGICGSCWAFASTGATEAMVNVFYNQLLNLDLSEQDLLSCSGAGDCNGGYPSMALDYIRGTGIVDEGAFPYSGTNEACTNKSTTPSERIKIGGRVDFGSTLYPRTEDDLKRMLIEMGPLSGGLYDWSHAMVMVGYQEVQEGDVFYYRDLELKRYWKTVSAGDPLIGKTVWIFKNSWSDRFGDKGYVYVETPITNIGWTHGLKTPVESLVKGYDVVCEDRDGDGYYWWGLGPKPAGCDCPEMADGDDSDPTLGPLDAYGNCTLLNVAPVADFKASATSVTLGQSVSFTDLSVNNPVSWSWQFEGGTPSTSTAKNPTVTYSAAGDFRVTLTVTNASGSNTKSVDNYITANEIILDYCDSKGSAAEEWIASVSLGTQIQNSGSSGTTGYEDFTAVEFSAESGQSPAFKLTPAFSKNPRTQYWRIWIDYNGDSDFDDAGELVFTSSLTSSPVSGTFTIPQGLNLTTRMRVAMKRGALPVLCETYSQGEVEDYSFRILAPVPQPPVAEFTAEKTNITIGESVQFTDLSQNEPSRWQWSFPGGSPSSSSEKNPKVSYNMPGEYDVTLEASKDGFTPSKKVKYKFIVADNNLPKDYCIPSGINSSPDYIQNVSIGNVLNITTTGNDYSLSANTVALEPGQNYRVSLTPKVSTNRNFWKIWIDLNGDGDFTDSDETLMTVSNKKGAISTTISVPAYALVNSRMRIAMRTGSVPAPCDDNYSGEVEDYPVSFGADVQAAAEASAENNAISQPSPENTGNQAILPENSGDEATSSGNTAPAPVLNENGTTGTTSSVSPVEPVQEGTISQGNLPDGASLPGNLTEMTTSAEQVEEGRIQCYPNPVVNILNLELSSVNPGDYYSLYSVNGQKLASELITSSPSTVDFSGRTPGIYIVVVVSDRMVFREKIVKR